MRDLSSRIVTLARLSCLCWIAILVASCGGESPEDHLAAAKALHAKGERNAAIIRLKSSIQEHSDHAQSRAYLGVLYEEAGDFRGAEKELRRALELKADPATVRPMLARSLLMQGEAKKVLSEIDTEGISDPEAVAGILATRGLAYLAQRQTDDARAAFDRALAIRPKFSEALMGRARLLALDRKLEEGLAEVDRAIESAPDNADALMLRGDFLRALGRGEEAQRSYEQVVKLRPDHVSGLLALVSLSTVSGQFDEASAHLAAVRKASPGNPMAAYFQALIAFRQKDFHAARDAIAGILKVAPNHLPSLLLGGAVEFALGSQELAQARLRYVVDRVPSNLYARRLLIASYARAGQTHKALEVLEPVLKQGSQDPTILSLAAEVYMQLNEFDKAGHFFKQAASLNPKNAAMRTGLGLSRLAAGDIDGATADLESASQLDTGGHRADAFLIATYLQRGEFDQALKSAQTLSSKQPDSPMAHNLLAAAYVGKKDLVSARRSLERALELQPGYAPAAANLAQLDLQSGDKKSARKRFEDILARDKSNVQAYIALASLGPRIDASKVEIESWLEAARKQSPSTIRPLVMLARFHFQHGEPKKALEIVEKALAGAPENPEVLELGGQVQLAAGEKNRALATFAKLVAVQPSAMSSFRVATAQLANDDPRGAINSLKKALDYRPQFPEAQVLLAQTLAATGNAGEAMRIAVSLQQQNPRSPIGSIVEGDIQMREKRFADAAKSYGRAYSLARSGPIAVKLHAALSQDGKSSQGESHVKEWLKMQPSDAGTRLYLAEAYIKTGNHKSAIEQYEVLLKDHPENILVLNNLAWCYQQQGDSRAVETAGKALKLQPDNPAVIDTLGWILVESGEVARGVELLKKAVALAPASPEIRYHYAQGLVRSGDKIKAKEELERLLLSSPKFAESGAAMKLLASLRGQ